MASAMISSIPVTVNAEISAGFTSAMPNRLILLLSCRTASRMVSRMVSARSESSVRSTPASDTRIRQSHTAKDIILCFLLIYIYTVPFFRQISEHFHMFDHSLLYAETAFAFFSAFLRASPYRGVQAVDITLYPQFIADLLIDRKVAKISRFLL